MNRNHKCRYRRPPCTPDTDPHTAKLVPACILVGPVRHTRNENPRITDGGLQKKAGRAA